MNENRGGRFFNQTGHKHNSHLTGGTGIDRFNNLNTLGISKPHLVRAPNPTRHPGLYDGVGNLAHKEDNNRIGNLGIHAMVNSGRYEPKQEHDWHRSIAQKLGGMGVFQHQDYRQNILK
tara:strand:+ start:117 stop:473 length:357 start_codon:yes stop_codon:yes gene_type:complete